MTEYVTCSVCGEEVGRLGIGKHAGMHRREFFQRFGRWPTSYQEVREKLPHGQPPGDVATLDEFTPGGRS